jgi:hypothetical protein
MKIIEKLTRQVDQAPIQIILLVLVCVAFYGRTLGFEYVWDDNLIFIIQDDLANGALSWHTLSKSVISGSSYFRPLVMLTWFIEFHLFGQKPWLSHAINVFIFTCNVLLVRSVALVLLKNMDFTSKPSVRASVAAMIYAIHPALIESTAWVSGRFDLMCILFMLLAARIFLAVQTKALIQFIGVLVFSLAAMLTKELGIVLIGTLFCLAMAARFCSVTTASDKLRHVAWRTIESYRWGFSGALCALILYFIIRRFSINQIYNLPISFHFFYFSLIQRQLPLEAMRLYTGLTVLPSATGISIFHLYAARSIWTVVSSLGTLALIGAVLWGSLVKRQVWAWLILAGFTGLVLVIYFIPILMSANVVQERFLAMPLVFFAMAAVSVRWNGILAFERTGISQKNKKFILGIAFGGWLLVCASTTLSVIPIWKSNLLLWANTYQRYPETYTVRLNYLEALVGAGYTTEIKKVLAPQINKNKRLKLVEQYYYALALLNGNAPEAMKYFDGVILALRYAPITPADQPSSPEAITTITAGGIYSRYALAKITTAGDIEAALHYSDIAMQYIPDTYKFQFTYVVATINYLAGNFDTGWHAIKSYINRYQPPEQHILELVGLKRIAQNYCNSLYSGKFKGTATNEAACKRLQKSDFFNKLDFFGPIP